MKKSIWQICAILLMVSIGSACTQSDTPNTDASGNGKNDSNGTLRVATEGAYAPFNYTQPDGSLDGLDVALANALCQKMQKTCQINAQDWDGIIPALQAGKYDMIVSAMSITDERRQVVDFSQPYFANQLVFIAKRDSNFDPAHIDSVQASVAAQRTTISSQWLEKTHPNIKIAQYDTLDNAFLDVKSGRSVAMIADIVPAKRWLSQNSEFAIKGAPIDIGDNIAIAMQKGDARLQEVDNALGALKADGMLDSIVQKYTENTL